MKQRVASIYSWMMIALRSMLRAGTLRRLMRRAHLRTAADEPAEARLARLMELAAREGGELTAARLRELLSDRSVTSRAELTALDVELRALEASATSPGVTGAIPESPATRP